MPKTEELFSPISIPKRSGIIELIKIDTFLGKFDKKLKKFVLDFNKDVKKRNALAKQVDKIKKERSKFTPGEVREGKRKRLDKDISELQKRLANDNIKLFAMQKVINKLRKREDIRTGKRKQSITGKIATQVSNLIPDFLKDI